MNGKKAKAARRAAKRLVPIVNQPERKIYQEKIYQEMKATLNEMRYR